METATAPINVMILQHSPDDTALLITRLRNTSINIGNIISAASLYEAVEILKKESHDIIFMNLDLPDSTGLKTFFRIQLHSRETPVVILTAEEDTAFALKAIAKGAQDLLINDDINEKILTKAILYSIERKRIAGSLQLSNERYNLVSRATSDMVWDWDLLNNRVYRSQEGWERLFGTPVNDENWMADSWLERVHPDDRQKTDALIDEILSNRELENFEIQCRMKKNDGTYAYVIDRGYAIRNENGEPIRLIGVTQNITEQKLAEDRLRASERRFRSIIEKSNEGLILVDVNGKALEISMSAKSILGFSDDTPLSEVRIDNTQVHPDDLHDIQTGYAEMRDMPNHVKMMECRYKKASGNFTWLEATFHNLLHEPDIQAVVVHFRDISSRKIFEDILKNSEEKYRNLFNVNPSSIIICDIHDFSVKEVNDAAVKEFGYSRKEFKDLRALDIVQPREVSKLKKLAHHILQDENYQVSNTLVIKTKPGELKVMETISQAIDYYGVRAVLTIGNNITEKIELERKLAEERIKNQKDITNAVIIAQEKEREILGKELHDNINQILVTTKLYIEYAMSNEENRGTLLNTAKNFIASAVNELRSLSKSLLPPSLGEVGLIMALDELVESIQAVNKFTLHTDWQDLEENQLSEELKLTIFRILQEQLSNIIKHAEAKNVWIKIKIKNQRLCLEVKDDGIGFNLTERNKGVGFKNIKSRAELHNGTNTVTSEPGDGCTLSVLFSL